MGGGGGGGDGRRINRVSAFLSYYFIQLCSFQQSVHFIKVVFREVKIQDLLV